MNLKLIVDIIICGLLFLMGFTMISKGRVVLINTDLYTEESVRRFSKPLGVMTWLLAIFFGCVFVSEAGVLESAEYLKWAGYAGIFAVIIAYFIGKQKILVAKQEKFRYRPNKSKEIKK